MIKSAERSTKSCCRITLDQDHIGLVLREVRIDSVDGTRGQSCQRLVGLHQGKVDIWDQIEGVKYLVEQLTMLACDANVGFEVRIFLHCENKRAEFNGLGPSTKNERYFSHGRESSRLIFFLGRPLGKAVSRRPVSSSRPRTNPSSPAGRPVLSLCQVRRTTPSFCADAK